MRTHLLLGIAVMLSGTKLVRFNICNNDIKIPKCKP